MTTVSAAGRRGPRKDAVRNQGKLLDAAGEVLRTEPENATMPLIAAKADLATATAYRYYSTLDELLSAYLHRVIASLRDFSHDCPATRTALFEAVATQWLTLLKTYGTAMIQLRAREGFLQRLHDREGVITTVHDAWERPVRSVMREFGVPDEEFEYSLFLFNLMFDPRELLDLERAGYSDEQIIQRQTRSYYAALKALVPDEEHQGR